MRQQRFKVGDLVFIDESLYENKVYTELYYQAYMGDIGILMSYGNNDNYSDVAHVFFQKKSKYLDIPDRRLSLVKDG